jgi:hypothetical protein
MPRTTYKSVLAKRREFIANLRAVAGDAADDPSVLDAVRERLGNHRITKHNIRHIWEQMCDTMSKPSGPSDTSRA